MHSEEAQTTFAHISIEDYKTRFVDGGEEHYLLDVRTEAEFKEARIPGTVNISLQELTGMVDDVVDEAGDLPVVLVCRSGQRSMMAAQILRNMGADELVLYNLETGTLGWAKADHPLETGDPQ